MIKEIIRDTQILKKPSALATPKDQADVRDLLDTFNANADRAAGMAANMIGVNKQIIVVKIGLMPLIMVNPQIISKSGEYQATEGCLSLFGERETKRFEDIEVKFLDINFKPQQQKFSDFIAEVIQHEIDHNQGIII